jgi:hypothetical protein
MKSKKLKKLVSEEVMLFKSGYDYIPFMCDIGSKNDKIFAMIFKQLPMQNSTVGERDVVIDQKNIYKIHVDDVDQIIKALHFINDKYPDQEILDWIDDIEYHLKHFKRNDPL